MLSNLTRLSFRSELFNCELGTIQVSKRKVSVYNVFKTYGSEFSLLFHSLAGHFHSRSLVVVRIFGSDAVCPCTDDQCMNFIKDCMLHTQARS